jgi:starch synthase
MKTLKILFCTSEVSPYSKTGGMADVTDALPKALQQLGCDVRIFTPLYRCVRDRLQDLTLLAEGLSIPVGIHDYHLQLWETRTASGLPLYLLEKDEFFDRSHLYGTPSHGDYEDNAERFVTFSRVIHPLCSRLGWYPDLLHLHDWQTALVAAYHYFQWRHDPNFRGSGTLFTIHNLAFHGLFPGSHFSLTGLPMDIFTLEGMEFWGNCSFLKAGLVYSDFLTTVSPTYSREIQQPRFSYGLEGILQRRQDRLVGILNGIDTSVWNPAMDTLIPQRYDSQDLSGKVRCKAHLLSDLGFPEESRHKPLLASIGRLTTQKGIDLLTTVMESLLDLPITLVILGTGDTELERLLRQMESRYPHQLRLLSLFDESLAHRIEAAADIFLMPSRYEPCGLNQMYSLQYGTVPVVYATGGLEDSVSDVMQDADGTGFKFYEYTPEAFLEAVRSALTLFPDTPRWTEIQRRGMARDFSWSRSAREYLSLYDRILAEKG